MYQLVREAVEILHLSKNRGRIFAVHAVSDFLHKLWSNRGDVIMGITMLLKYSGIPIECFLI
jgi:hypothetical protein